MTAAAKERRALRNNLHTRVLEYLNTQSPMRYRSRPSQLRSAARQIAFRAVARRWRFVLAAA